MKEKKFRDFLPLHIRLCVRSGLQAAVQLIEKERQIACLCQKIGVGNEFGQVRAGAEGPRALPGPKTAQPAIHEAEWI